MLKFVLLLPAFMVCYAQPQPSQPKEAYAVQSTQPAPTLSDAQRVNLWQLHSAVKEAEARVHQAVAAVYQAREQLTAASTSLQDTVSGLERSHPGWRIGEGMRWAPVVPPTVTAPSSSQK